MKRTSLQRSGTLRRSAMKKRRTRKGDDSTLRADYMAMHDECACCGSAIVDCHHILGGAYSRPDIWANLIALCRSCHDLAHANKLTRPMVLMLKLQVDVFEPLQAFMGNRILEQPEAVPDEFRRRA